MSFVAAAVGAGASLLGGMMQSDAIGDAASTQAASTAEGLAEQRRQFDLQREDFAPYRAAGTRALGQLEQDINAPLNPADVTSEPGYQFGLQQGQQALDRKIAAMGGRVSGSALKAAARFGTDYGGTQYNAAYQRRQDRLNRLASLAGIGQTATGSSAAAGAQSANAISGLIERQGEASGAAGLARANVWAGTGNQIAAMYGRRQPGGGAVNYRYDDPYSDPNYFGGGEGE